jgi:membrane protein involved in colicin uptake
MAVKRIRKLPSAPNDDVFNKLKRMSVRLTVQ